MNAMNPITSAATAAVALSSPTALIARDALTAAVNTAALVAPKRGTYPIVGNARLRGDGGQLFVTTCNLDMMVDVAVPGAADADFDVTLPAHLLRNLLKSAPKAADMVAFTMPPVGTSTVEGAAVPVFDAPCPVDFGAVKYSLAALHPDAFPDVKGPTDAVAFTMPAADLFEGLSRCRFAISTEETRYYLNGIYAHISGNQLRFVATDGHRLARQTFDVPTDAEAMHGAIIPTMTVELLCKLLKPTKGADLPDVSIEVSEAGVRFGIGNVTVTSKLIEGSFPDYDRVTPQHNDKSATFEIAPMMEAIKAVQLIAAEAGHKAVKLAIDNGRCCLSANSAEGNNAESTIAVAHDFEHGFAQFEIGFNSGYLMTILSEIKANGSDVAEFRFSDSGGPALIVAPDNADWLSVLMPMRT